MELALPAECMKDGEKSPFSAPAAEEEDEWGDDSWGENEEEKSEKSADKVDAKQAEDKPVDIEVPDFVVSDVEQFFLHVSVKRVVLVFSSESKVT